MAKAYYFEYIGASDAFKNNIVEANTVGTLFLKCVYETLGEYGVNTDPNLCGKIQDYQYHSNDRFRGRIAYYQRGGLLTASDDCINVSLSTDNKFIVDFQIDPLIPENSNHEIIEDIGKKAFAAHLTNSQGAVETSSMNSYDKLSSDRRSSGCYVATAVYGSYDCPEVWTLRRFRDLYLSRSWYGRTFIRIYYATSPTLVKFFGKTGWFKHFWKNKLDKLVVFLKDKGYCDSPYND